MIPLPKKGNLRHCQTYRTTSLVSHPSKVMLRVILSLKAKAEGLLAEEQAGFRAGLSAMDHMFNCRVLIEKHLQHQRDLLHNFVDFKKAFDRVWHEGLWHVLRGVNMRKDSFRSIRPSMNTPAALFSTTTSWENFSRQPLASGKDACSPQYYSTCSW